MCLSSYEILSYLFCFSSVLSSSSADSFLLKGAKSTPNLRWPFATLVDTLWKCILLFEILVVHIRSLLIAVITSEDIVLGYVRAPILASFALFNLLACLCFQLFFFSEDIYRTASPYATTPFRC